MKKLSVATRFFIKLGLALALVLGCAILLTSVLVDAPLIIRASVCFVIMVACFFLGMSGGADLVIEAEQIVEEQKKE